MLATYMFKEICFITQARERMRGKNTASVDSLHLQAKLSTVYIYIIGISGQAERGDYEI